MGKYVSVMPYEDDLEFKLFVRENLFFAIKGTIKAFETTHVSYDEYCDKKIKMNVMIIIVMLLMNILLKMVYP